MEKKFLEGCKKIKENQYRIRENFNITKNNSKKINLTESVSLLESDGKKYKCIAAYEMKIWELNKPNLNNRIYTEKLAKHVIKENLVTNGLANHPKNDEDGDVLTTFAVEKNPHIVDGWLCADIYLVGDNGQLAQDILEAGGVIGLSSSALGNLNESSGEVELDENFVLERYGDWVDSPSNSYKNTIETEKKISESVQSNNENITILTEINNNKDKKMNKNSFSLEEKIFTDYINRRMREIKDFTIEEKLNQYNELLECFEDETVKTYKVDTLKSEVLTKLNESKKEYSELANKGKEADSLKETKKQIKEKYENLEKQYKLLETRYNKVIEIAENTKNFYVKYKKLFEFEKAKSNSKVEATHYLKSHMNGKDLETKLTKSIEENKNLKGKINLLEKELKSSVEKLNSQTQKIKTIIENKKKHTEELEKKAILAKLEADKKFLAEKKLAEQKRKSQELNIRNNEEVSDYYLEMVKIYPFLKESKHRILNCKTLKEAYKIFLELKDGNNKITERTILKVDTFGDKEDKSLKFQKYENVMDKALDGFQY